MEVMKEGCGRNTIELQLQWLALNKARMAQLVNSFYERECNRIREMNSSREIDGRV